MKIELETKYNIGQCFKLLPEYGDEISKIIGIVYVPDEDCKYYYLTIDAFDQAQVDSGCYPGKINYSKMETLEDQLDSEYTLVPLEEYKYQYEQEFLTLKSNKE